MFANNSLVYIYVLYKNIKNMFNSRENRIYRTHGHRDIRMSKQVCQLHNNI